MDLVMKGRGIRITDQVRRTAEHKLARIGRLNPTVTRLQVEVTLERNPRIGASHRVEVACDTARQTFRAGAVGADVESALDQVIEHYSKGAKRHPNLDFRARPMNFDNGQKATLAAFLRTLSDQQFINDVKYSDPFQ